jgi:hypothetical protein
VQGAHERVNAHPVRRELVWIRTDLTARNTMSRLHEREAQSPRAAMKSNPVNSTVRHATFVNPHSVEILTRESFVNSAIPPAVQRPLRRTEVLQTSTLFQFANSKALRPQ